MRSLVISALSRPRATSSRSVFMLTGITSCTIGSTKAPPSSTTFWPPRPVRTKARSLRAAQVQPVQQPDDDRDDDRDDDQAEDEGAELGAGHGASPDVLSRDLHEAARRLGERHLGGQALHRAGAVEAVAVGAVREDVAARRRASRSGRRGTARCTSGLTALRRRGPGVDRRDAVGQRQRRARRRSRRRWSGPGGRRRCRRRPRPSSRASSSLKT